MPGAGFPPSKVGDGGPLSAWLQPVSPRVQLSNCVCVCVYVCRVVRSLTYVSGACCGGLRQNWRQVLMIFGKGKARIHN